MKPSPLDCEVFPEGCFNIGGKTFDWVYQNKTEFVNFTHTDMKKATGFFLIWKQYVADRISATRFPIDSL